MANYSLALDKVASFALTEQNVAGTFDPIDPTDVFSVTANTDATNLSAVIGTVTLPGGTAPVPCLTVNWLHSVTPMLTGIEVTFADSLGNKPGSQMFDMIAPAVVPDQTGIDVTNVVQTTQPVPV